MYRKQLLCGLAFALLLLETNVSIALVHDDGKEIGSAAPAGSGGGGPFASRNVNLLSHLELDQIGGGGSVIGNDCWGWTESLSGRKFAIMGLTNATSFIEITNPSNPVYLGKLNTHVAGQNTAWRDIKVYNDHAFIVADGGGNAQGMQVFDLKQLLTQSGPPANFSETAHYDNGGQLTNSHNIAINEETGFAYVVGGPNSGGLHIVDIRDISDIKFAGSFSADGYTHDAQVVSYRGPDATYAGREIAFASNEDTLTIVDVTNKSSTQQIARTPYSGSAYAHQGWLSDDQRYFFSDDELDERRYAAGPDGVLGNADDLPAEPTRTFIWDVSDLDNPVNIGFYNGVENTIDHNQYVKGDFIYQANYTAGLRILKMVDVQNGILEEFGFFDSYMSANDLSFNGAWSVYPYFDNDLMILSDRQGGLFVLQTVPEPTSWALIALGTVCCALRRRHKVR